MLHTVNKLEFDSILKALSFGFDNFTCARYFIRSSTLARLLDALAFIVMTSLPPFAPFPTASLRAELVPTEWAACLDAWVALAEAHLSLSDAQASSLTAKDESATSFLVAFMRETAAGGASILGSSEKARTLLKDVFLLTSRLLRCSPPPSTLAQWDYLADLCKAYGKKRAASLVAALPKPAESLLDSSLTGLKKFLIKNLDAGLSGNINEVEERLHRVNPLIHTSPRVASFFLAGDDFLDGLISCYKIMNPPLRKVIITTTYLCLVGLIEGESPKYSLLTDQLYSLKNAANTHKTGPLNVNDSLVAELVTCTPLLQQVEHKLEMSGTSTSRARTVLKDLAAFRKAGGIPRPKRLIRRKIDKGKGVAPSDQAMVQQEVHVHRMSQITQVQDLFPELGSGFVSRLLDEYQDDTEQVIAHLLEGSLPSHLQDADRSEQLYVFHNMTL
jgi:activating signal cointegrator complex subunit 2